MNDIVTKENWTSDPDNAPLPSDFIRIESNTRKVEENRQEETDGRIASDETLQENIEIEHALIVNIGTLNAIGSLAFLANYGSCVPGATVTQSYDSPYGGGLLRYAGVTYVGNVYSVGSPSPTGTWKCLGYGPGTDGGPGASLYIKVS
jgi:hypothetical protein